MENNNEFKQLVNRILITTLIFGLIFTVYSYPNLKQLVNFNKDEVQHYTLKDTISVRSNEGLSHQIIINYHVKVDPSKMDDKLKRVYNSDKNFYFNHSILYPVKESVMTNVMKQVIIKNNSLAENLSNFRKVISTTVEPIVFDEMIKVRKDIEITSYDFTIDIDPYVLVILEKRLEQRKLVEANRKLVQEAAKAIKNLSNVK